MRTLDTKVFLYRRFHYHFSIPTYARHLDILLLGNMVKFAPKNTLGSLHDILVFLKSRLGLMGGCTLER